MQKNWSEDYSLVQTRDDGGLDQNGGRGNGFEWTNMEEESCMYTAELEMRYSV